jgi:DNA polymerase-1
MKRLVIIDGKSVFYRGYYAMPNLSTRDGTPTGGVYGFVSLALEAFKKLQPDYVVVAWDKPKTNIRRRKEIYAEYKAGRKPAPSDFYAQIPILHELLEALGWPLYECDDYEADDIMGTLSQQANAKGVESILITSDLDMLQLIDHDTKVYALKKGFSQIEEFDLAAFEKKYGLKQSQFLDLKALKGDSSDNIPGVPGVGEKTATTLLQDYGTLEGVYQHINEIKGAVQAKLLAGKDSAFMSKKLAEIWLDAPVTFDEKATDVKSLDRVKLRQMLEKLEFRSLIRNLPENMQDELTAPALQKLTPAVVMDLSEVQKVQLVMAEQLVVLMRGNDLIISTEAATAVRLPIKQAINIVANQEIIGYDTKEIIKKMLDQGVEQLPHVIHDIRQAAFLIDATRRAGSLAEVVGAELGEDDIQEGLEIAALWDAYKNQKDVLADMPKVQKIMNEIDLPMTPILAKMEYHGIKIVPQFFAKMSLELGEQLSSLEKNAHDMAGRTFNLASPAQLAVILFDDLKLPTVGIKKGKTGYSTGIKELEKLRGKHEIVEVIEKFRELSKLKNTYVDTLPKLADNHDRIHTTFNQDGAATGRLSSIDPNLQNIPVRTELGRRIRQGFVASNDKLFISADYSQFELRLAAVMSGDEPMVKAFNDGEDIHTLTASQIAGITPGEVTKEMRYKAKAVNFGILYGQGVHGLAQGTGMSFAESKSFIDRYYDVRPKLKAFMDSLREKAHADGYVETLFGRRRPTPDVKSSNFIVRSAAERAAINMPIQGTAADLTKKAMIAVDEKLGDQATQLLQIHDSILLECDEKTAVNVSEELKQIMENIYPELGVKLKVDVAIGKKWSEV